MERIYYDVHAHGQGWRVQTLGAGWDYPTRSDAMARATSYARHQWMLCHLPSGVRERDADGAWRVAGRFGSACPGAAGQAADAAPGAHQVT